MARAVVKRDGREEIFYPDKLKDALEKACKSAGLSEERIKEVITKVAAVTIAFVDTEDLVTSQQIRDMIFSELERLGEKRVIEAWEKFEEEKRKKREAQGL
ncbi:MAG: ATP cone domain-containing protein [Minisyncoccales bacterium]